LKTGKKKSVVVSVINDLVTDQRVDKTCQLLTEMGFSVLLVGRVKRESHAMPVRAYNTKRMKLLYEKGPCFYAEFNLRLFLFLLFKKAHLLVSNDLDTLWPNYLIHKWKKIPIVYDSHELFTETPEVIHRKFVQSTWLKIERSIFPKLKDVITVCDSIADIFKEKYKVDVKVVRNIPPQRNIKNHKTRRELDLPEDKKILILQGSGINIQRGAEELVEAMQFIPDYLLLIIGGGDVIANLKKQTAGLKLKNIRFLPKQPMESLISYTRNADLGLTLDKDTNLNYRYSLPNKLFDYIHAGIPVLASPLVEISKIIHKYEVGTTIKNHDPKHISEKIKEVLNNENQLSLWKENLKFAAEDLSWDREKEILIKIYQQYA
jgi:glycosyltransferase involved in cell wall biosynthesis